MPEKLSLEDYLGQSGYASPIDSYGNDKFILPHGETQRQRDQRIKEITEHSENYHSERSRLINEYYEKVNSGEIVEPTQIERSIAKATHGHPDNESTQAAIRMLQKRGYSQNENGEWIKLEKGSESRMSPIKRDYILTPSQEFDKKSLSEFFKNNPADKYAFVNCRFNSITLNGQNIAIMSDCRFDNCKFESFNGTGTDMGHSVLSDCIIENSDFSNASFISSEFTGTRVSNSNFRNSNFTLARLRHSSFNQTDLSSSGFWGTNLNETYFNNMIINEPVKGLTKGTITISGATNQEVATYRGKVLDALGIEPLNKLDPTRYEIELIAQYENIVGVPESQRVTEWFGDYGMYEVKPNITEPIFTKQLNYVLEQTDLTIEEVNSGLLSDQDIKVAVERSRTSSFQTEETIVAQYKDPYDNLNVIKQYPNGKFYNHYGYDMGNGISNSRAGAFDSLEEAKTAMTKHRSSSVEISEPLNSIENMNIDISKRPLTKEEFDQLTSEIKDIAKNYESDPNLLSDYFAFKAQFYQYSPTNTMLIYLQNPHATFVASFTKWKQLGYSIKSGQHHIKISRPIEISKFPKETNGKTVWTDTKYATPEEKAKIAKGELEIKKETKFIPHRVFDISQTTCPVEEYPKFYNMGHPDIEQQQLYECVKQYAKESGFTVTEEDLSSISLHGYYDPANDSIHINSLMKDSKRLEVMCHELAHGVLHKTSTQPAEIKEFEAESFSAMLKRKMGFPVSEESKRYIKQYATKCTALKNTKFDMSKTLDRLSKTFNHISKGIDEKISDMGFSPEREIAHNLSQARMNSIDPAKISANFTQAL